jgi:hypothetical protein
MLIGIVLGIPIKSEKDLLLHFLELFMSHQIKSTKSNIIF